MALDLGSLPNQVQALDNAFPPLAQLGSPIPRGHDLTKKALAEIGNRQRRGWVQKELLALRQKQWVESLDLTRNAAPIAGAEGDPGSGDPTAPSLPKQSQRPDARVTAQVGE